MVYSLGLFAFFGLMAAQCLGAGFSYLYPWHHVHRDHRREQVDRIVS
jgi:hypothetical protein